MAFQTSNKDLEALELIKRSLIQKNDIICHLQAEVENWKLKYCSKEKEVHILKEQLNEQQNCSSTNYVKDFGRDSGGKNSNSYEVDVKEEAIDEDNWLDDESECILGRSSNKRSLTELESENSMSQSEYLKRSRLYEDAHTPDITAERIPSLCCDGLPAAPGSSTNASLMGSSSSQDTVQLRPSEQPSGDRPQHTCSKCGSVFINHLDLDAHGCTQPETQHYSCPWAPRGCGYRTRNLWSLRQHYQTHTGVKPFACPVEGCTFLSARNSTLKIHLRTHTGEKPFVCAAEGCGYRCAVLSNMKAHARSHTGEKPFACPVEGCGYRSAFSSAMKKHALAHTGEKPFVCTVEGCGYSCAERNKLLNHARSHTGEKPFECPMEGCGYRSARSAHLTIHARTHTGEKPFACQVEGCGYRCTVSSSMTKHARTHTGEKPFACPVEGCGHRCSELSSMKRHAQTHIS